MTAQAYLLGAFQVVGCTAGVVALTLRVRDALARRGRPLPRTTLWLSREQIPVEWLAGLSLAPSLQNNGRTDRLTEISGDELPAAWIESLSRMRAPGSTPETTTPPTNTGEPS